jgi:hypothetical protein
MKHTRCVTHALGSRLAGLEWCTLARTLQAAVGAGVQLAKLQSYQHSAARFSQLFDSLARQGTSRDGCCTMSDGAGAAEAPAAASLAVPKRTRELLFAVCRFLEGGPCAEAGAVLRSEMERQQVRILTFLVAVAIGGVASLRFLVTLVSHTVVTPDAAMASVRMCGHVALDGEAMSSPQRRLPPISAHPTHRFVFAPHTCTLERDVVHLCFDKRLHDSGAKPLEERTRPVPARKKVHV